MSNEAHNKAQRVYYAKKKLDPAFVEQKRMHRAKAYAIEKKEREARVKVVKIHKPKVFKTVAECDAYHLGLQINLGKSLCL